MVLYLDPTKKTINVDDVRMAFREIEKSSAAGKKGGPSAQPGTVSLAAVRKFFGHDC